MSKGFGVAIAAVVCLAFPLAAAAQKDRLVEQPQFTGNLNLFLGAKALDEEDWEPVDSQTEGGIMFDGRSADWPVNIAVDLLFSLGAEDEFDPFFGNLALTGSTMELDLGVRKYFDPTPETSVYVGGGLAYGSGEFEVEFEDLFFSDSASASGVGFWFDLGGFVRLAEHFNIGIEFRYSIISAEFDDVTIDLGGAHFGVMLGYHW